MKPLGAPMRWPGPWKDPAAVDLLKGTAIDCLLVEPGADQSAIVARARQEGLQVAEPSSPPAGVDLIKGQWPGVRLSASGAANQADAGPTGVPWIDSNGWKIHLAAAVKPGVAVWVDAPPPGKLIAAEPYLIALADAAAHGGRWVISLDDALARDIAAGAPEAIRTWKSLTAAAAFFSARQNWTSYLPEGVLGIVSDFSGKNEFLSGEILNLVARTNQQYRVIPKDKFPVSLPGALRAFLYADAEQPSPALRKQILTFVEAGAMLITGPGWGQPPGSPAPGQDHPRYALRTLGKGRVAVAKEELDDPYLAANDSAILLSHRHELLRLWNPGAASSYLSVAPDRKRAAVQMVFYASARVTDGPTMRVLGRYRTARLWTLDQAAPRSVEMVALKDALELHLPLVAVYAGLELEA